MNRESSLDPTQRPQILDYLDFRKFLLDLYQYLKTKNKQFNIAFIASEVGLRSLGHITWIFQGKRNISKKHLEGFVNTFGLDGAEANYFRHLVGFNQSTVASQKKKHFEKMLELQGKSQKVIQPEQYDYFQNWFVPALREAIDIWPIKEDGFRQLGARFRPALSQAQVRKGIRILEQLQLVEKDQAGFYRQKNSVISTGEDWRSVVIYNFQKEAAKLGETAIDTWKPEERDISTLTFSISEQGWEKMKGKISQFRKELIELITHDSQSDRVGHLNLQLFPVTEKKVDVLKKRRSRDAG